MRRRHCEFNQFKSFKEALTEVRFCSRMEDLLLKKRSINVGDSPEVHFQKKFDHLYLSIKMVEAAWIGLTTLVDGSTHTQQVLVVFHPMKIFAASRTLVDGSTPTQQVQLNRRNKFLMLKCGPERKGDA